MFSMLAAKMWESKSELIAHLSSSGSATLLLGVDAEAPRRFYSFSVACSHSPVEIGVVCSFHGIEAAAALVDRGPLLLVGHDTSVTWVDVKTIAVVTSLLLEGPFYRFLSLDSESDIIVLHELGALRVDSSGTVKWNVDTDDIIEDWSVDPYGNLILILMNGSTRVVSTVDGT